MSNNSPLKSTPYDNTTSQQNTLGPSLHVMRLFRPSFYQNYNILPSLNMSLPSTNNSNSNINNKKIFSSPYEFDFTLSGSLSLPDSFGDIYLGEHFSAYIAIYNQHPYPLSQLSISARLHTPSRQGLLPDKRLKNNDSLEYLNDFIDPGQPKDLNYLESRDLIIENTMSELGKHTLRVVVTYRDQFSSTNELKTLKKLYKFSVLNPVTFHTINHKIDDNNIYIQATLENKMSTNLNLDSITFYPEEGYEVKEINGKKTIEEIINNNNNNNNNIEENKLDIVNSFSPLELFDNLIYLAPEEKKRFLFHLTINPNNNNKEFIPGKTLGYFIVYWRKLLGEIGKIRSQPVICDAIVDRQINLSIDLKSIPNIIYEREIFKVKLKIENNTNTLLPLRLECNFDQMNGIVVTGNSIIGLGEILPYNDNNDIDNNNIKYIELELMALSSGFFPLQGLSLVDKRTYKEYSQGILCNLLIERKI